MRYIIVICALICLISGGAWSQTAASSPDEDGFALLIDIPNYGDVNIPPMPSTSRGINDVKEAINQVGGFPEGQIYVLASEKATREGIIEALTTVVERAKTRLNPRFFLYFRGRSSKVSEKNFLLTYSARVGAISTYISESEFRGWLDQIRFKKSFIQAAWDIGDRDAKDFSSQMAGILRDENTDADGDRNITLTELESKIANLGFSSDYPIASIGDGATVVIKLPSVLEVNSQPPGAAILIDGKEKGRTPERHSGLATGIHTILVKKDLYKLPEGQNIQISARGQRIIAKSYQLVPIKVQGTVHKADNRAIADVDVSISGTGYQQAAGKEGSFSFENWQAYGLLESGKEYELIARSSDNIYEGKTSFVFGGTEDINLNISLTSKNWIKELDEQLAAGDKASVIATLDTQLAAGLSENDLRGLSPALAQFTLERLGEKIKAEPENLKWYAISARLAEIANDTSLAKNHWKVIKAKAARDSQEYKQAEDRLKELGKSSSGLIFGILAAVVIALGVLGFVMYRRRGPGKFREIPNPYIAGKPISERDMFFGREDVFDFIKDKFSRSAKDITIVLYGGRRTGKTSIMYQIANGRLGDNFVPVFIDMQEMAGVDAHDFFRLIAQKVVEVLNKALLTSEDDKAKLNELYYRLEDKTKSAYQNFNDFMTGATSTLKGKYLIFLIDEYEILERKVNEGHLTDEIFTYLRHLMEHWGNLAFIFAGSSEFRRRERKEWSLMFNMAQPKEVSFLKDESAIALIREPVRNYVRYDKKAIERILRLTSGQPFFIQAICLHIIEDLNDKQQNMVTVGHVEEACRDIVENAPFHLSYLWGELASDEKAMVAILAETLPDGASYASVSDIMAKMSYYSLDYSTDDINKVMARLREEHLIQKEDQTEAYRFRMDLIRSWIKAEHPTWGVLREVQNGK